MFLAMYTLRWYCSAFIRYSALQSEYSARKWRFSASYTQKYFANSE